MNDKDKCPKCGAEQKTDTEFACSSYYFTPYGQSPEPPRFFESTQCYRNQFKAAKSLLFVIGELAVINFDDRIVQLVDGFLKGFTITKEEFQRILETSDYADTRVREKFLLDQLTEKETELQAMTERTELDLKEIFRLRAENGRLKEAKLKDADAIIDKLPKTADGVTIVPGMIVYHPDHLCNRTLYSQLFISFPRKAHSGDHDFIALIQDCYSTWELAEAAANIKKEGKE